MQSQYTAETNNKVYTRGHLTHASLPLFVSREIYGQICSLIQKRYFKSRVFLMNFLKTRTHLSLFSVLT